MNHTTLTPQGEGLFHLRLGEQLKMSHLPIRLSQLINWVATERIFRAEFNSGHDRPALLPRLIAGLLYLRHTNAACGQAIVVTWLENPCWQYFWGKTYLQNEPPIDSSRLTRWRQRIGEEGVEVLLALSNEAAHAAGMIKISNVDMIIVKTTIMPRRSHIPLTAACWRIAASIYSSWQIRKALNCIRTTTAKLRA